MNLRKIYNYSEEDIISMVEFKIEQAEIVLELTSNIYSIKYTPNIEDCYSGLSELENVILDFYSKSKVELLDKIDNKKFLEELKEELQKREYFKELFYKFKVIKKEPSIEYGKILDEVNEIYIKDDKGYLINEIDKYLGK